MTKLNQIIAIDKGVKSRVYGEITDLHKQVQKPDLFNGFTKKYSAKDEAGEQFPDENKHVQMIAEDVLKRVSHLTTDLMDVNGKREWTNCAPQASADVKVDDKIIIPKVPAPYLLFLEKQLSDLKDMVDKLPLLDANEVWTKDENSGLHRSGESQTHRTKKVQKPIVLYNATDKHPAQTQLITEDEIVGHWHQTKLSGAVPKARKEELQTGIETLTRAVKAAREEANMVEVVPVPNVGAAIFEFLKF